MDRLGARRQRRRDNRIRRKVALRGRRRSQSNRNVRCPDVASMAIRVAVHGHGLDAHLATGPHDPYGDLAAVGHQDTAEGSINVSQRGGAVPGSSAVFAQRRRGQSGMLPCFFLGLSARLSASISSAAINRGRVCEGWITASM